MTNAEATAQKLSADARTALINVGTNRQGAKVTGADVATELELNMAGLIGEGAGLTRTGTIVRQRLVDLALESAFG